MTEPAEFDEFVAARSRALLRTAWLLTGDKGHAEDLVQSALAKAWLRWDRVGGVEHVEAYVRRILLTTYLTWWRRRRVKEVFATAPADPATGDHAGGVGLREDVTTALRRLPRGQRAVVVLRFYEDLTEAQTAAVLGCSVGTVKSQTSRALDRLRGDAALAPAQEVRP